MTISLQSIGRKCYVCNREMIVPFPNREHLGLPRNCHLECIGKIQNLRDEKQ